MQGTDQGAMESQGHGKTAAGKLPPSEVNKALAFEAVISAMEKHMGKSCWELLGMGKAEFTAKQLKTAGGGHPKKRAVQKHWTKAKHLSLIHI